MLNRVILIGRLTRDPELRYTANGNAMVTFTLAVDRAYKNAQGEKETDFINITVWRQLGEHCAKYLSKGKLAAVDGRLQIRSYEGQDGQKRIAAQVVAEDVRFLSPRESSAAPASNRGFSEDSSQGSGFDNDFDNSPDFPSGDDDLPF